MTLRRVVEGVVENAVCCGDSRGNGSDGAAVRRQLMCCSVLQCVAVCCSVLQCVAVCCSVLQCVAVCSNVMQCVAVC